MNEIYVYMYVTMARCIIQIMADHEMAIEATIKKPKSTKQWALTA